jgi:hypothetical protein
MLKGTAQAGDGSGEGLQHGNYRLTLRITVIVWSPGFTVSCPFRATRLVDVTVTVTLAPEASDPEEGVTLRLPASEDPGVME